MSEGSSGANTDKKSNKTESRSAGSQCSTVPCEDDIEAIELVCHNILQAILDQLEADWQEELVAKTPKMLRFERKQARRRARFEATSLKERQYKTQISKQWNRWSYLPPELLSRVFWRLSMRDRHSASQVCAHWSKCFYIPQVWSNFVLDDLALTKRKFNYYLGYQRMLDPFKTQAYLKRFGACLRNIRIESMSNFYNLFEFIKILHNYSECFESHFQRNPLSGVRRFSLRFGCEYSSSDYTGNEHRSQYSSNQERPLSLYNLPTGPIGTGGRVLQALKELLYKLDRLEALSLSNLFLDLPDAGRLLDGIVEHCHMSLRHLTLINCSRQFYGFYHCGVLVNLVSAALSPQHISEDVLSLLRDLKHFQDLYIVQNEFTLHQYSAQTRSTWKALNRAGDGHHSLPKQVRVHLVYVDNRSSVIRTSRQSEPVRHPKTALIVQPADVCSVIFDSPYTSLDFARIGTLLQHYSGSLLNLEFYQLPKFKQGRHYVDRPDQDLIWLSQKCLNLETLFLREVISTATLILIVSNSRSLRRLIVRRNAIRRRFDCGRNNCWSSGFYEWLKNTSISYEATFEYVRSKLGSDWTPLTDEQFKTIKPKHRF